MDLFSITYFLFSLTCYITIMQKKKGMYRVIMVIVIIGMRLVTT